MTHDFLPLFSWSYFSAKLRKKILNPRSCGLFQSPPSASMRHVMCKEGSYEQGALITLSLIVDESDGVIADSKFLCYGPSFLIGACEATCELLLRKTVSQGARITRELIDKTLRDRPDCPAFPPQTEDYLALIVDALRELTGQCQDIDIDVQTPVDALPISDGEMVENWEGLSPAEKLTTLNQILTKEVRPYVQLDEGDVKVTEIKGDFDVVIAYEGACTSCYSATGSTLDAIQSILKARVHPQIRVTPSLDTLSGMGQTPPL